jgi:glutamyl-tRNA reductase
MQQRIYLLGLNHRTAPLEVRERFALSGVSNRNIDCLESGPLREVLALSTCNRVEILAVGECGCDPASILLNRWAAACQADPEHLREHCYLYSDLEAVSHIFTVAASLDSMVVGEPQILGQLKDAYRTAVQEGTSRVIINRLMHKAFSVAKRIRTETGIAQNAVSISYAAVELAKDIFDTLNRQRAMLLGAGEMAELAATYLLNAGVSDLVVSNRTLSRAEELANRFGGRPLPFVEMFNHLHEADIVISSTGSQETIIKAQDMPQVLKKRKNRPMFFIDIAVPRDIDPDLNNLDNVYLYDIDDLKGVVEDNLAQRREEAELARSIIQDEVERFEKWRQSLSLKPTIVDLLQHGEELAQKELNKTLKKLGPDLDPEVKQAMETLAYSLSKKLYHHPVTFLKRRAQEEEFLQYYVSLTRRMFDLDQEGTSPPTHVSRESNDSIDGGPNDPESEQ